VEDKLTVIIFTNRRAAKQAAIANGVAAFCISGLKPKRGQQLTGSQRLIVLLLGR
jgi:hypothetical protein